MSNFSRRQFLISAAVLAGSAILLPLQKAQAQVVRLDPKDPMASRLGYTPNAASVDAKKYPSYQAGRQCSNCAQFKDNGTCSLFAGKQVSADGWCMSWAKKK